MTMEIIIISIIVVLSLISIFLGILNWFQLSSASSQISILEDEIEKKTKEFDLLKKERKPLLEHTFSQASTQHENRNNNLLSSYDPEADNPPIEVVRSVGTGFQSVDAFPRKENPAGVPPATGSQSTEVLDIVEEGFPKISQRDPDTGITIALYSSIKKDTDFPSAWKKLLAQMPLAPTLDVVLDFKNIMFLFEKELYYLEKIRDIVEKERGTIKFINCHPELQTLIASRPALARFIEQPQQP